MNNQDKIDQLNKNQMVNIQYINNSNGEKTKRQIISTTNIPTNIKAIDVTNLSQTDKTDLLQLYNDYADYKRQELNKLFNFSDWILHTKGVRLDVKWRTFKINNIQNVIN